METLNSTAKKCPFCAEDILADAVKCKHCGEMLNKKIRFNCEILDEKKQLRQRWFDAYTAESVATHIAEKGWKLISIWRKGKLK